MSNSDTQKSYQQAKPLQPRTPLQEHALQRSPAKINIDEIDNPFKKLSFNEQVKENAQISKNTTRPVTQPSFRSNLNISTLQQPQSLNDTLNTSTISAISVGGKRRKVKIVQSRFMDFAKPKPTPSLEISLLDQSMSGKQNLNQTISVINRRPLTTRKKHARAVVRRNLYSANRAPQASSILNRSVVIPQPKTTKSNLNQSMIVKQTPQRINKPVKSSVLNTSFIQTPRIILAGMIMDLRLMETVLLQLHYMNAKAEKAFQSQEFKAMEQLYRGWLLLQQKKKVVYEKQYELERDKCIAEIENLLSVQVNALNNSNVVKDPIYENLLKTFSEFQENYDKFAKVLRSTTNQLPTRGILTSENEECETEQAILQELQKSEAILETMNNEIQKYFEQVYSMGKSLEQLHSALTEAKLEIQHNTKTLEAVKALESEERSLEIQNIQIQSPYSLASVVGIN